MSGRIRTVKPEWMEDERLGAASDAARVLSVALLLLADDHGNGRAHPMFIASHVWSYADPVEALRRATGALEELGGIGFVVFYDVAGQRYFHVRNWRKHQRVDRPGPARVPSPPDCVPLSSAPPPSSSPPPPPVPVPPAPPTLRPGCDAVPPAPALAPPPSSPPPPVEAAPSSPSPKGPDVVAEVWAVYLEGWRAHVGTGSAPRLDDKRKRLIRTRAKDFTADELKMAARGVWCSSWHVEQRQTSPDLVFRDSAHVERFITEARGARPTSAPRPPSIVAEEQRRRREAPRPPSVPGALSLPLPDFGGIGLGGVRG